MRRADLLIAALFAALGLVTIFVLVPRYVENSGSTGDLTPAFMPYVAATIGTAAMVLLFCIRLRRDDGNGDAAPLPRSSWLFIGAAAAVFATAFVLMDAIGYVAGAAALVAGFLLLVRANLKVVIATSVVLPLALWVLFDKLLDFPLP